MTKNYVILPVLALGAALFAQGQTGTPSPTKIGVINIQSAILATKDGQKAANELQTRFAPKKAELEKKQSTIAQLQDQLRKGSNTMSEDAKQKLMREIDQNTKSLNRDTEDAQAELDQEQNKVLQELGQKIYAVITKYGHDNAYSLILDVSSPQTPVMYVANGSDITQDIVGLYDKNSGTPTTSTTPPAASPAAPPAAAKPIVPPVKK